MKLTFDKSQSFAVPDSLCLLLNDELARVSVPDANTGGIIFNFRDVDYSSDDGGFHPVEIRLGKCLACTTEHWTGQMLMSWQLYF